MSKDNIKREFMKIILKELRHAIEQSNYNQMYAKVSILELILQEV